jgi:hypothetical protein
MLMVMNPILKCSQAMLPFVSVFFLGTDFFTSPGWFFVGRFSVLFSHLISVVPPGGRSMQKRLVRQHCIQT